VRKNFLPFLAFLLLAANLRPALTAVGPLVGSIQKATGLSGTSVGLLNSLPLLAFAAFAPLARFGRRVGLERTVAIAMFMLLVGVLLRSGGTTWALFAGTIVLGAGIAVGNVLAPTIIKRDYPERVGSLTTVYALVLALTAAIGTGLAVPFERSLPGGWQGALAIWAVPAVPAVAMWAYASLRPNDPAPPIEESATANVWRSPLAWCVTAFMGLQSLCFYVVVAWFPSVIQDSGYDPAVAAFWSRSSSSSPSWPAQPCRNCSPSGTISARSRCSCRSSFSSESSECCCIRTGWSSGSGSADSVAESASLWRWHSSVCARAITIRPHRFPSCPNRWVT